MDEHNSNVEDQARKLKADYMRKWRADNPDKVKAQNKARAEYMRKWRAANPDKVKEHRKRYWERKALKAMEEATHGEQ